jgi:phosphatidylglycerophosphatase A
VKTSIVLFVAQGFGVGRIPVAPGTFGSLLGLGWFALLLAPGNLWVFIGGTILGLAASVWLCGVAEKVLGQTDPGSVVLDEITAMPVCFATWLAINFRTNRELMPGGEFFADGGWIWTLIVFSLFRLFDVTKPWPVKQSQRLSGGWGVTIDDVLAAIYTNAGFIALTIAWVRWKSR